MTMCLLYESMSKTPAGRKESSYPREAKEVRIAMRAALGTVDLIQMLQRETQLRSQAFGSFPELALR